MIALLTGEIIKKDLDSIIFNAGILLMGFYNSTGIFQLKFKF